MKKSRLSQEGSRLNGNCESKPVCLTKHLVPILALLLEQYIIRQLTDTLFQFSLHPPATSGDLGVMMVKKKLESSRQF